MNEVKADMGYEVYAKGDRVLLCKDYPPIIPIGSQLEVVSELDSSAYSTIKCRTLQLFSDGVEQTLPKDWLRRVEEKVPCCYPAEETVEKASVPEIPEKVIDYSNGTPLEKAANASSYFKRGCLNDSVDDERLYVLGIINAVFDDKVIQERMFDSAGEPTEEWVDTPTDDPEVIWDLLDRPYDYRVKPEGFDEVKRSLEVTAADIKVTSEILENLLCKERSLKDQLYSLS